MRYTVVFYLHGNIVAQVPMEEKDERTARMKALAMATPNLPYETPFERQLKIHRAEIKWHDTIKESGRAPYEPGDKVRFVPDTLVNENKARSGRVNWLGDDYLTKARSYFGQVGTITRHFGPGYEYNLTFADGQIFHIKHHYVEMV